MHYYVKKTLHLFDFFIFGWAVSKESGDFQGWEYWTSVKVGSHATRQGFAFKMMSYESMISVVREDIARLED